MQNRIEILPVALLDEHRPLVSSLKKLAHSLGLDFGWHYLLDLTWIINRLGVVKDKKVIDAGAGTGVLQWYLADRGARVISIDRMSRARLSLRFRQRFRVSGLRSSDLVPTYKMVQGAIRDYREFPSHWRAQVRDLIGLAEPRRADGQVIIYNQDLKNLEHIQDESIDAVVAVSALEHNPSEDLEILVAELMRVLKPGGALLATLGAARDEDWFHKPSHGWCYGEASLRRLFGISDDVPSNYDRYDQLLTELVNCAELRRNLAKFYFLSGDNGMPWGKWDPQYQSVGVCKVKRQP
jgi:SAM-dependent methyltransferase